MSTFSDGVFQYGGSPVGASPGIGVPGNTYWVHPAGSNSSDDNRGTNPKRALKTITQAHTNMTANQNDTVFMLGNSSAATANVIAATANVTLSKNLCHYIGTAYNRVSHRVSIRNDGNGLDSLITVSASGCTFANFHVFDGNATAEDTTTWTETGQRNAHYNLHIAGMGSTTASAPATRANSIGVLLTGDGERFFKDCVIGVDTQTRSAANTSLECQSAAVRDWFEDCFFPCFSDDAAAVFLRIATSGIDRWLYFKKCMFHNAINSTGTALTQAFDLAAGVGGTVILDDTHQVGCTDIWDNAAGGDVVVHAAMAAGTSGHMISAT